MLLKQIEADRLRNLKAVQFEAAPGLNVIAGRNGQGKTSLLESMYLLATGRSFRTRKQEELIGWDGGPLRVSGVIESNRGTTKLTAVMDGSERSLLVAGQPQPLDGYLGRLDLVDLTGPRMDVLKSGPSERRKFLDRGIVGLDPTYLHSLGEYRRILQQRNALLRGEAARDWTLQNAQLDVWDERLARAGADVHRRRREYAMRLAAQMGGIERALFPQGGEVRLHYKPSPRLMAEKDLNEIESVLLGALAAGRSRDRLLGHTSTGPHRDELVVELNGADLRKFGSAGQVRAAMIALKVAKLTIIRLDRGEAPLFLMDDYDTDIDEIRAAALAQFLNDGGFQSIVATSKEKMAENLGVPFTLVRMEGGTLRSEAAT